MVSYGVLRFFNQQPSTDLFFFVLSLRSAPFNINDIGRVHITLDRPAREGRKAHRELVRVEVNIEGPIIFIQFSKETEPWPFRIQNDTDFELDFCQTVS